MGQTDTLEEFLLAYKCQNSECGFYFTQKVPWGNYFCPKCKYTTRPIFDYYRVFGLEREFTINELKGKYKRLSLRYHPDKNQSEMSEEFITIRKGYEILSNETDKEIYDHELILFKHFEEGKPIVEEEEDRKELDRREMFGYGVLLLVGLSISGGVYYYSQNYYYFALSLLIWISAAIMWKDLFLKWIRYLVELFVVFAVGYTLFKQRWIETLILVLGLLIYYLIKRRDLRGD